MERKLIDYLPPVVRDFAEFRAITAGQQPEFELVWDAAEKVFDNQFIETATDCGLSRWENMLKLSPKATDTLESRRAKVQAKINNFVPYPFKVLVQMLTAISDGEPFELKLDPGSYFLEILTYWSATGQIEGLEYLIETVIPCNMAVNTVNNLLCSAEGKILFIGGVCTMNHFFITNDEVIQEEIHGAAKIGGGNVNAETLLISNDEQGIYTVKGNAKQGAAFINSATVVITNDFNEIFNISGSNYTGGGAAMINVIEARN